MTGGLLTVHAPEGAETPLVVEIPHAGLDVPAHFLPDLLASARAIGRDADLYVDELYGAAHREGASVLIAQTSRYVVDLNRAEDDIDAHSVAGGPDVHAPRGVVWRNTGEGDRALAAPLRREAFEERLREIYRPYHARLASLIEQKKERFGCAVVLAAHSMPSLGRGSHVDRGSLRADVVPGTLGRSSADARFIDLVDAHAREAGFSVAHDDPYKGGFTTRHYGRPAVGVHVVQVELARRLYMDEVTFRRRSGRFDAVQAWCRDLVAKLGRAALTFSSSSEGA
jgi:N-formylglutamate amidohydrolase